MAKSLPGSATLREPRIKRTKSQKTMPKNLRKKKRRGQGKP